MALATKSLSGVLADRYVIERELGRGGMATVYLAEERKHGRKVAIKIMNPELAASVGAERFLREIGIAARLAHPHIVPLIDSGDADGVLYYVSPFVAGGSLRHRLDRESRLPVSEALRITREAGAGLDFAHRAGFVHRDVKPENILFADGHALLADFGVARATVGEEDERVTGAGIALGTPEYMSPEQATGEHPLGLTTDVYSLACVLYEMLAGEPPFHGSNARATMAKHVTETPRPLRQLRPDVPQGIEAIVARSLSKDPALRFPSVAEFTAALRSDAHEHRVIVRTATRSIAVLPFVNASSDPENEYLSDGITDELIHALSTVQGLRVASRTSVFALKGKPQDIRAIGALLGVSVILEGTVRKAGNLLRISAQLTSADDGSLLWSERVDRTLEDVLSVQEELAGTIVAALQARFLTDLTAPVPKRYTGNAKAYALYLRGRHAWNKRSSEGVTEAIGFFEQAIAEDPTYALAYTGLSDAYALHVDYRSVPVHDGFAHAKKYARYALQLDERLAEAHTSLAWCLFIYDWDWERAEEEFRRAIELAPQYATAHQWYGMLLNARGKMQDAIIAGHTAQELDPTSVSVRRSLGWLYYYARRFDQARHHLTRAIEMSPTGAETHRVLGMLLADEGEFAEAERVLREALRLTEVNSYTMSTLGYALARAGRTVEAREILGELTERSRQGYVSPVAFATVHLGLGDRELALDWIERARDDRRGWVAYLRVNPIFDSLRREQRFEALARSLGL